MSDMSKVYIKNPNIVARKIAGEMVLVPIRQNADDLASIYNLNEVGAFIWELLDGKLAAEQVRGQIAAEYEVTPQQAEVDLLEFLSQLEQIGAINTMASSVQ